ncbi:GNAT family N-acetyltransferase [Bacillus sp. MUM 13]|uniref:GNAT family N-acetyltransferase n=1 Tax=Bacillus sp. MUM 13 TaxID=1678001 RepID=UPI0008F5C2E6|nr:GNAT family N-acetyltransferase [Bacillus sp. MUM 13]OIK14911.1 N-acetyltransferase [Bacillus sp. MUM 13]
MKKPFPVLETDRLILRQVIDSDKNDMFEYLSDPRVMQYYGMEPFTESKSIQSEIDWYSSIFSEKSGVRWGICLKDDGKMIGSCGFHNRESKHFRAEIGYELHHDYWGKGIAKEALTAILLYGFTELKLMRIQAFIEPANDSSRSLVKKLGFKEEGLLRKYEYTVGKFDDLYIYSLLKGEM